MSQFNSYKILCTYCGKPSKVRIERMNVADTFIVDKIDVHTGALIVSKQRYEHKSEAELMDDALFCVSCGELLLDEHINQMQWADVLDELAANFGNEFENTPASYYIDRVNGVSDISRIENCDKLAKLLLAALMHVEGITANPPKFPLKRAYKTLREAGYLKPENKS